MTREGTVTELPGIGKTLEEKLGALLETGDDPGAAEAAGEVPARPRRDHAPARPRPQARAPALRRARHRLASQALRRPPPQAQPLRDVKGFGAKFEESRARGDRRRRRRRAAPSASCSTGRWRSARRSLDELRRAPGLERGPARRRRPGARPTASRTSTSSPPPRTRGRWPMPSATSTCSRSAGGVGDAGAARADAQRARDRPASRRARPVRQPAPALHRLQAPQRALREAGRQEGGCTSASTASSTTPRARPIVARPRRRSTRCSASLPRARAAREPRRARGRLRPAPTSSASTTCAATCTATRSPATATTRSGDGACRARARHEYLAITDHSASHGFGNDVSPTELASTSRRSAGQRRARRHHAAGRHRDEHPARRVTGLRRRSARPSSTGSWRPSTRRSA